MDVEPIEENEIIDEIIEEEIKINPYHNAKIYKIVSKNTDKIYIGSTTQTLSERLKKHEYGYECFKKGKSNNVSSFKILEFGDYSIELIKNVKVESRLELTKIEGQQIKDNVNVVNKNIAGRTHKESVKNYYNNHKEEINNFHKNYWQNNKDEINEKKKNKHTCDICGGKYTNQNKSQHQKTTIHLKAIKPSP